MSRVPLTTTGWAVLGGSVVIAAAGWGLAHRELMVAATVGIVAIVCALPWGWLRYALEADRAIAPDPVMRDDAAEASLRVRRRSSWQPTLVVRDRIAGRVVETVVPRSRAGEPFAARYRVPTHRRGIVAVGPLTVVRSDPLGLVSSTQVVGQATTLKVYPRVHAVVPLSSGHRRDLEGPIEDRASGSITFQSLREYVPGDDLRMIHWRSTARTGTLMVRQHVDPGHPQITVVLDTRRATYEAGDAGALCFEHAVDAVASAVVAATSHRFPVRLVTTGGLRAEGRAGVGDASPLLEDLTTVDLAVDGSLAELLTRLGTEPAGRSLLVVTGRASTEELAAVRILGRRYAAAAMVQFQDGATPQAVREHGGLLDVVAPDAHRFAELWNRAV